MLGRCQTTLRCQTHQQSNQQPQPSVGPPPQAVRRRLQECNTMAAAHSQQARALRLQPQKRQRAPLKQPRCQGSRRGEGGGGFSRSACPRSRSRPALGRDNRRRLRRLLWVLARGPSLRRSLSAPTRSSSRMRTSSQRPCRAARQVGLRGLLKCCGCGLRFIQAPPADACRTCGWFADPSPSAQLPLRCCPTAAFQRRRLPARLWQQAGMEPPPEAAAAAAEQQEQQQGRPPGWPAAFMINSQEVCGPCQPSE